MSALDPRSVYLAFHAIEAAAIAGDRCPTLTQLDKRLIASHLPGTAQQIIRELAAEGYIAFTIYAANNYRVTEILSGEHAGKCTAPAESGIAVLRQVGPVPGRPKPPELKK